jgi:hypothetical protein
MDQKGRALMSSAITHVRRVRRTTGRLLVSGLGFGLAYYFDLENGGARREHLRRSLRRTAFTVDTTWAPEFGDAPVVFTPLLQAFGAKDYEPRPAHFELN